MHIKLLALDSSSKSCSVAVLSEQGITEKTLLDTTKGASKALIPMLNAALVAARLTLKDLDGLVISQGPAASFTGLRLSASLAQGIAFSFNLPVIPVSTLAAQAQQWLSQHDASSLDSIGVVIDAKMQSYYYASYFIKDGAVAKPQTAPTIMSLDVLQQAISLNPPSVLLTEVPLLLDTTAKTQQIIEPQHLNARYLLSLAASKLKTQPLSSFKAEDATLDYLRTEAFWTIN